MRRTAAAQAPRNGRHSSARHRRAARQATARWTGSGPAQERAPAHSVRLPRSSRRSPCLAGSTADLLRNLLAVIVLPVPLLLQFVGDTFGHVGLIMLVQHG